MRLTLTYYTDPFRYKLELIEFIIEIKTETSMKKKTINYFKASIFTLKIENS